MNEKPLSLYYMSIALFIVALSFPLQIMALYGHPLTEIDAIFANLSITNLAVMLGSVVTGFMILTVSRYALASLAVLTLLVIGNNIYVGLASTDFNLTTTSLATLAFAGVLTPGLVFGGFQILKTPKLQWWRTSPRHSVEIPVIVRPLKGHSLRATTFDLSEGGAFIPCHLEGWGHLSPGDFINVQMTFGDLRVFKCEAEVVRKKSAEGKYPEGLAVRFTTMDKRARKILSTQIPLS